MIEHMSVSQRANAIEYDVLVERIPTAIFELVGEFYRLREDAELCVVMSLLSDRTMEVLEEWLTKILLDHARVSIHWGRWARTMATTLDTLYKYNPNPRIANIRVMLKMSGLNYK